MEFKLKNKNLFNINSYTHIVQKCCYANNTNLEQEIVKEKLERLPNWQRIKDNVDNWLSLLAKDVNKTK